MPTTRRKPETITQQLLPHRANGQWVIPRWLLPLLATMLSAGAAVGVVHYQVQQLAANFDALNASVQRLVAEEARRAAIIEHLTAEALQGQRFTRADGDALEDRIEDHERRLGRLEGRREQ